jgi:hypothetical protein
LSSQIVSKVGLETTEVKEVEELIKEPEKILEVLRELYEKVLQVTANYNYYTFFTVSTKNLPFFYLTKAYPKLKEKFDELREFLGLGVIFKPETEVQEIKEECTIWSHAKEGLCDLIFNLNDSIWKNIYSSSNLLPTFSFVSPSLKDLKKEYLNKVEEKLKLIGWKIFSIARGGTLYYCNFSISGIVVKVGSTSFPGFVEKDFRSYYDGKGLSYVLNDFSPALFLGYLYVEEARSDYLSFRRVQ